MRSRLQTIPSKTTNKPRGTWGHSGSAELAGTSGDEDGLGRTSGEEDELGGASRDTSRLPFTANGDGLVLAADSGRLPASAGLGELQMPVISILFRVDYSVTVHTGIQEQGDEDCDKRGI